MERENIMELNERNPIETLREIRNLLLITRKDFPNDDYNGIKEIFYENGKLKLKCFFKNGKLHGKYRDYFHNGSLKNVMNFNDNTINGTVYQYYDTGSVYQKCIMKKIYLMENFKFFGETEIFKKKQYFLIIM
jgi:antitoxin component YwqK of YwqJK toxin-antitoxin module